MSFSSNVSFWKVRNLLGHPVVASVYSLEGNLHWDTRLLSLHKCIREPAREFYRQSFKQCQQRQAVTNNGHPQGCKWVLQTNKPENCCFIRKEPQCMKIIKKLSFQNVTSETNFLDFYSLKNFFCLFEIFANLYNCFVLLHNLCNKTVLKIQKDFSSPKKVF